MLPGDSLDHAPHARTRPAAGVSPRVHPDPDLEWLLTVCPSLLGARSGHGAIVGKTEGMTLLGDGALFLINDDDFGITGQRTQIVVVRGTGIMRK